MGSRVVDDDVSRPYRSSRCLLCVLLVFLFYPITVENFEKLTFEVAIFYMDSYGTAGKNESSRVFLKRDKIFYQYKTYDFKD